MFHMIMKQEFFGCSEWKSYSRLPMAMLEGQGGMVVLMCAPQDAYQCTRHVSGVEKHDTILSCNKSDTN